MPLVQISLIDGREPRAIRAAIARVTDALAETLGAPRDTIRVIVHEVPATHWGVGGVPKGGAAAPPQAKVTSPSDLAS
jgi:4-oxalocrotonate tautomerase